MADMYLPVMLRDWPSEWFFDPDGRCRRHVEHYLRINVLRLIAGPQQCHAIIDVRRPYSRPPVPVSDTPIEVK